MRAKCLAQERNTMSLARAEKTAQSGDERTNHEATAPPVQYLVVCIFLVYTQALHNY